MLGINISVSDTFFKTKDGDYSLISNLLLSFFCYKYKLRVIEHLNCFYCIQRLFYCDSLAGCATASTTAKTAEATGRYLLEIDRSNDQSSNRGKILLSIVFIIPHSVHRSLE